MATIIFNQRLDLSQEVAWAAKNGRTRTHLKLISKLGLPSPSVGKTCLANVGTLAKGNHAFVFLNEPRGRDERVLGCFLNSAQGFTQVAGPPPLFEASSYGGPRNSESKIGLYHPESVVQVHTYANRSTPTYYRFRGEEWQEIPAHEWEADEQTSL